MPETGVEWSDTHPRKAEMWWEEDLVFIVLHDKLIKNFKIVTPEY